MRKFGSSGYQFSASFCRIGRRAGDPARATRLPKMGFRGDFYLCLRKSLRLRALRRAWSLFLVRFLSFICVSPLNFA